MKNLMQVIINTEGKHIIVTQERDSFGRFIKGASVVRGLSFDCLKVCDVIVSHHYQNHRQSVHVTGNHPKFVIFDNDGLPKTDLSEYHSVQ